MHIYMYAYKYMYIRYIRLYVKAYRYALLSEVVNDLQIPLQSIYLVLLEGHREADEAEGVDEVQEVGLRHL